VFLYSLGSNSKTFSAIHHSQNKAHFLLYLLVTIYDRKSLCAILVFYCCTSFTPNVSPCNYNLWLFCIFLWLTGLRWEILSWMLMWYNQMATVVGVTWRFSWLDRQKPFHSLTCCFCWDDRKRWLLTGNLLFLFAPWNYLAFLRIIGLRLWTQASFSASVLETEAKVSYHLDLEITKITFAIFHWPNKSLSPI
jgi:hypothetical protein